jgi:hypothetical protein
MAHDLDIDLDVGEFDLMDRASTYNRYDNIHDSFKILGKYFGFTDDDIQFHTKIRKSGIYHQDIPEDKQQRVEISFGLDKKLYFGTHIGFEWTRGGQYSAMLIQLDIGDDYWSGKVTAPMSPYNLVFIKQ